MITPEEQEKEIKKWSNRLDLPPNHCFLKEFDGWVLPDGALVTNYKLDKEEASRKLLLPEIEELEEKRDIAKQKNREEALELEPSIDVLEGTDLISDEINDTYKKELGKLALKKGIIRLKIIDGIVLAKPIITKQAKAIEDIANMVSLLTEKKKELQIQSRSEI